MKTPLTLRGIAKACGVSLSTVSYALRNDPRLTPETCARVQQFARDMGYRPNPLVTTLMAQVRSARSSESGHILGFINTFEQHAKDSHYISRFFLGVERRARQLGYGVEEFMLGKRRMTGKRLSTILFHRGITGLIIGPHYKAKGHLSLQWEHFCAAAIGYSIFRPDFHRASNHHLHTMRLACRQLTRKGYRRLGYAVEAAVDDRVDQNWLAGFLVHQQRVDLRDRVPPLLARTWDQKTFTEWLTTQRPQVVISVHGEVHRWIIESGCRVPEDVGFVHLDWTPDMTEFAGVDQRSELVGSAAVDLVAGQLHRNERGIPEHSKVLLVSGCWRNGSSTRDMRKNRRNVDDSSSPTTVLTRESDG